MAKHRKGRHRKPPARRVHRLIAIGLMTTVIAFGRS